MAPTIPASVDFLLSFIPSGAVMVTIGLPSLKDTWNKYWLPLKSAITSPSPVAFGGMFFCLPSAISIN